MVKTVVYHYTNRPHQPGDAIVSSGDFIERHPARKAVEAATRGAHARGEAIRSQSLYAFEDMELAKLAAKGKKVPHVYALTYEPEDVLFRGDIQWLTEAQAALDGGDDAAAKVAIDGYWSGAVCPKGTKPRFEVLLRKATVGIDVLSIGS